MSEDAVRRMFEQMGGGFGFPFGRNQDTRKKEIKIPDIVQKLNVSIVDIYKGSLIEFKIDRYNLRSGKQPTKENLVCNDCKGNGSVTRVVQIGPGMMQQSTQNCDKCGGQGTSFPSEFFEKKTQADRAFISNYQELGYLKNDKLTVLLPKQRVQSYMIDPKTMQATPTEIDETLLKEAIAYYQTASAEFKSGQLKAPFYSEK